MPKIQGLGFSNTFTNCTVYRGKTGRNAVPFMLWFSLRPHSPTSIRMQWFRLPKQVFTSPNVLMAIYINTKTNLTLSEIRFQFCHNKKRAPHIRLTSPAPSPQGFQFLHFLLTGVRTAYPISGTKSGRDWNTYKKLISIFLNPNTQKLQLWTLSQIMGFWQVLPSKLWNIITVMFFILKYLDRKPSFYQQLRVQKLH